MLLSSHVILPKDLAKTLPKSRLLTETEVSFFVRFAVEFCFMFDRSPRDRKVERHWSAAIEGLAALRYPSVRTRGDN